MDDLRELYQATILDHYKSPRNFGAPESHDRDAEGYNPLCGDRLTVYLNLDGDRVIGARFEGQGCAISTASASLMTEIVKGKSFAEIESVFAAYHPGRADTRRTARSSASGSLRRSVKACGRRTIAGSG